MKPNVIDKQVLIKFMFYSKDQLCCPLCKNKENDLIIDDYVTTPMFWCDKCYYTIYDEIGDIEDGFNLKSLYVHNVVDSEALWNARCYYSKHKTLPYLTPEERKDWNKWRDSEDSDKWRKSLPYEFPNNDEVSLDDPHDERDKHFESILFSHIGEPVNHWYIDRHLSHDGVFCAIQTSNSEDTPYEDRQTHYK